MLTAFQCTCHKKMDEEFPTIAERLFKNYIKKTKKKAISVVLSKYDFFCGDYIIYRYEFLLCKIPRFLKYKTT